MVQEIVGLGFERIRADSKDGIGQLGILVTVVQLADAHVARGMDLRVIGRAIVDPDVLDLHALEIELPGRPGVFIAAAGTTMVEGRDDKAVLALLLDHAPRDLGDKIQRIVP